MRRALIVRVVGAIIAFYVVMALAAAGRGIELKSRAAAFRGGPARAIMGGAEILVPETWLLQVATTRALMGGVDYPESAKAATDVDGPVLELSLLAIMGGIEVKAQAPDSDTRAVPTTRG